MNRLKKYEFTNELSNTAMDVYSNSDFTFYTDSNGIFWVADNCKSDPQELGRLEAVEKYLVAFADTGEITGRELFESLVDDWLADHAAEMADLVIESIYWDEELNEWAAEASDAKTSYILIPDCYGSITINYCGEK